MFKIYTIRVFRSDAYGEEATQYRAQFSTLAAAEATFKHVAEKFNVEINIENVQTGYACRPWENDYGDDLLLEITLESSEVYESYSEEYARSSLLPNLKRGLSLRLN